MSCVMKREPFVTSLQDTLSMKIESGKSWSVALGIFLFTFLLLLLFMHHLDISLTCLGEALISLH